MGPGPILVVEDDPSTLDFVAELLRIEGYAVLTAAHGEEALSVLAQTTPALIIFDLRMAVLDGWQLARRLRQIDDHPPLVVMTAMMDARHAAEQIGADAFLQKPFEVDELLEVVARFLHH